MAHPIPLLINGLSARQGGGKTFFLNLANYLSRDTAFKVSVLGADNLLSEITTESVIKVAAPSSTKNPLLRKIWERKTLPSLMKLNPHGILISLDGMKPCAIPQGWKFVAFFQNMLTFDATERARYPWGKERLRLSLLHFLQKSSFSKADLIVVFSEHSKEVIAQALPQRKGEIVVINHAVSDVFKKGLETSSISPLPYPYVLYVSTIDYYKAHAEVTRAWAVARKSSDRKEKLVFVGAANKGTLAHLKEVIRNEGLNDEVILYGTVPHTELPRWYQHATLGVFASSCETGAFTVLEALAAGQPLLCSNRAPMPELGGDAVVYFDPYNPEELAKLFVKYCDSPSLRSELSSRARVQADKFTSSSTLPLLAAALRAIK